MWLHDRLKAKKYTKDTVKNCYLQEKLDGHRATLFKQSHGIVMFGRDDRPHLELLSRFSRLHEVPIIKWMRENAPPQSSVDCEIITDGPASNVPTALRDESLLLEVVPFAVPFWNGKSFFHYWLPEAERLIPFKFAPYHYRSYATVESLLKESKSEGKEGWVIKNANYFGWWKIKVERTVDCIVMSVVEGKGKYLGQIGALVVGLIDDGEIKAIANVSGMNDFERIDLTEMSDEHRIKGKVVEVQYQCVGANRLRHPRFKRLRNDKLACECVMEQIK